MTKCTSGRDIVHLGPWRGTVAGGNKEGDTCDGMQSGQGDGVGEVDKVDGVVEVSNLKAICNRTAPKLSDNRII
jgi:hypothetical protein